MLAHGMRKTGLASGSTSGPSAAARSPSGAFPEEISTGPTSRSERRRSHGTGWSAPPQRVRIDRNVQGGDEAARRQGRRRHRRGSRDREDVPPGGDAPDPIPLPAPGLAVSADGSKRPSAHLAALDPTWPGPPWDRGRCHVHVPGGGGSRGARSGWERASDRIRANSAR